MRSRGRPGVGVAVLSAALLALAVWLWTRSAPTPASGALAPPAAVDGDPTEARLASAALQPAGDATRAPARTEGEPAAPARPAATPPADDREDVPPPARVDLLARFVRPDKQPVAPASASVELDGPGGERRVVVVEGADSALVDGLAVGRWTVRVDAPGFVHREQAFDLTPRATLDPRHAAVLERGGRLAEASNVAEERLVLWPAGWVAVVVRTPDGRPFRALAEDLGWEPKRLFSESFAAPPAPSQPTDGPGRASRTVFEVRARATPPDERAWSGPPEDVARFRPPPGYQSWQLTDGVLGSLELARDPPLWVGLAYLGVPVGWELVRPGQREVAFVLAGDALDERLARVSLRVVDAASGRPVEGALVTLRADTSAHRRADLEDVATGADGRAVVARAMPGAHELSVRKDESLAQDHVVLAPGESRDLGDVALASGPPIPLRVVDANGTPVAGAYVEVGRHEAGARVAVLYPQMLRYTTEDDGTFAVPRPPARAIVRASIDDGRSDGRIHGDTHSANAIVEPDASPTKELVLVLREPIQVRFEFRPDDAATVEALDELGVVVHWGQPARDGRTRLALLPGRYRARFLDGQGRAVGEAPFEAAGADTLVVWP